MVVETEEGWDQLEFCHRQVPADSFSGNIKDDNLLKNLIQYSNHCLESRGFDICLDIPPGIHPEDAPFIQLSLDDPYHRDLITHSANLAIQRCNAKKGKSLVLVEVLKANFAPAWEDVETFVPLPEVTPAPLNLESSAESQDLKRPRIMLDQYIACSVCEKELSDVLVERNRRLKVYGTLCQGPIRLDHPYHRCRNKQCAKAALAEYNTREDLNLSLCEVLKADLSNFESNKLQYLIQFRCAPHLGSSSATVLKAKCLYEDDRHGEKIGVKDLVAAIEKTRNNTGTQIMNFVI